MAGSIAEVRKPEIIEAALKAIGAHGLPMPSYDQIARHAGMSRQLIRHYFPDPEALMVGVCEALAARYRDLIEQGVLRANGANRLTVFVDFYLDFLAGEGLRKPEDNAVYDAMFTLCHASGKVRGSLFEQCTLLQQMFAEELAASHPDLPRQACREIAFLFVGMIYGHWKMVATLGFSQEYNRVTREAVDRLIQSYKQRYEGARSDR